MYRISFLSVLLILLVIITVSSAETIHVPGDYATIQEAIDASSWGDSILVASGDYFEILSITGKSIYLIGEGSDSVRVYQTTYTENLLTITATTPLLVWVEGITFETSKRIILCNYATLYLKDCTLRDGQTNTGFGAGLYCSNSPSLTIEGCIIEYNTVEESNNLGGGGIHLYNVQVVTIVNSRIEHNIADDLADRNRGDSFGGGIYARGASGIQTSITIKNCSISYNASTASGAIYISGYPDIVILHNCVFACNATYSSPTVMRIKADLLDIRNCIFWDNDDNQFQIWLHGSNNHIAYCDIEDSTSAVYGTYTWGPGNIDVDPQLVPGLLSDFHLNPANSPCIDAGDPDPHYNDTEDPDYPGFAAWPALGTTRNDMGMFGGPGVAYWLEGSTGLYEPEITFPGSGYSLSIHPNPVRGIIAADIQLASASAIILSVYDLYGRLLESITTGIYPAGSHHLQLDGQQPGIYFCRMVSGDFTATQRFVVID